MKKLSFYLSTMCLLFTVPLLGCATSLEQKGSDVGESIQSPSNDAVNASVEGDVNNAVAQAMAYIAQNPDKNNFAAFRLTASRPETSLKITGNFESFEIVGSNAQTGYSYSSGLR